MRPTRRLAGARWVLLGLFFALGVVLLPAAQAKEEEGRPPIDDALLARLSLGPLVRFLQQHPGRAPEQVAERLDALGEAGRGHAAPVAPQQVPGEVPAGVGAPFNRDDLGLPQNEESVAACGQGTVLGGTNDFRGLLNPRGNFTGWHFSTDDGATVANEGLLRPDPHRCRREQGDTLGRVSQRQ